MLTAGGGLLPSLSQLPQPTVRAPPPHPGPSPAAFLTSPALAGSWWFCWRTSVWSHNTSCLLSSLCVSSLGARSSLALYSDLCLPVCTPLWTQWGLALLGAALPRAGLAGLGQQRAAPLRGEEGCRPPSCPACRAWSSDIPPGSPRPGRAAWAVGVTQAPVCSSS